LFIIYDFIHFNIILETDDFSLYTFTYIFNIILDTDYCSLYTITYDILILYCTLTIHYIRLHTTFSFYTVHWLWFIIYDYIHFNIILCTDYSLYSSTYDILILYVHWLLFIIYDYIWHFLILYTEFCSLYTITYDILILYCTLTIVHYIRLHTTF
jgi:hypothetical protein